MGCDIHMYVEYKTKVNEKEKWVSGDYFKPNPYHGEWEGEDKLDRMELYGARNYGLFSTLAGVRDYTDAMIPVSDPKGIPEDTCQYIKNENERWGSDGHTHSWLTLSELKKYQEKNLKLKRTGLLSPQQLEDFNKGILPESWCQGTNQPGYERREWEEENTTLIPIIEKLQKRAHELMQYEFDKYDEANDDKIRIVFWFDN